MTKPLTLAKLRAITKLLRAGVEGADEELSAILRDRWDELHPLLDLTLPQAVRISEHEHAIEALARAVEAASQTAQLHRTGKRQLLAVIAASRLADAMITRSDGWVSLPVSLLSDVLGQWQGDGEVCFGALGAVRLARLRSLLRHVRALPTTSVALGCGALVLAYSAPGTRGTVRLRLVEPAGDRVLHIPLGEPASQRVA